ncbi:MAG: MBL fold metallo-hydrolase [Thermoplasmata archaeon]
MARSTISFLGGVREIGGNKLVVEDGAERILFDFGPSFSPAFEQFYVDFLQPRTASPVKDLLEFDLIPRIEGLYSEAALSGADLAYRAPEFHGVFLTHAHADHAGYLQYIDPKIPVYVGKGTFALLEAISQSTGQKYGEHDWRIFEDRKPVRVGGIEVVPHPVDHSIPFAYGFIVRTSEGSIAYTGDFRHHGPRAADTLAFFDAVEAEKVDAIAIEGTRAGNDPRRNFSEDGVRREVNRVLGSTHDIALACTYPRDVDRLLTLHAAARAAGRELLVSSRTAFLLNSMAPLFPPGAVPIPGKSPGLSVYARKKRMTYLWERPFLDAALPAEDVRRTGDRYLLALDFYHFPEMIDLRPPSNSPFIHSMSEPFSEDDVSDEVMHRWLDHFGLTFFQAHASGHASGPELMALLDQVRAGAVFPIHTENPEAFRVHSGRVVPPELRQAYRIGGSAGVSR